MKQSKINIDNQIIKTLITSKSVHNNKQLEKNNIELFRFTK